MVESPTLLRKGRLLLWQLYEVKDVCYLANGKSKRRLLLYAYMVHIYMAR